MLLCTGRQGENTAKISWLLDHLKDPHTAERICEQLEAINDEYTINDELDFIISDTVKSIHSVLPH